MARIKLTKRDINKAFEEALSPQTTKASGNQLLQQLITKAQTQKQLPAQPPRR